MSGVIWTKFFWSDWETDPALRLCSFAAQGLWMRMLCIAAVHDPIGYVAVAGRGLDETSIARMTGGLESEVSSLLGELDRNGVFSRDRHGRIYSRRMVSDAKKSAAARKFGKEGGNPKLKHGYNKPGFVYLMGVRGDGAYKIGISNNPENRLKKVRQQYPGADLRVLSAWHVEDMGAEEARAHSLFPPSKRSGEWFFLSHVDVGKLSAFFETLKGSENGTRKPQEPRARSQEPERETRAPTGNLEEQNRQVSEAAGDALADMAVCPGIANLSALRALIGGDPPCDWALDVLPAVTAAAAWHRGKTGPGSMRSWTTAARIAVENRDKRLAGAPAGQRPAVGAAGWDDDTWRVAIRNWRADASRWSLSMGPRPGEPGCVAPSRLLIEETAA